MKQITINGRIEFCEEQSKKFDRDFTATLGESGAFQYGNGTAVIVEFGKMANGRSCEPKILDTRYADIEQTKEGFEQFIRQWFKDEYLKHTLIIK